MKLIKLSQNYNYYSNLSEEEQIKRVRRNPYVIEYIQNPYQEVQLEAVKQYGGAIQYIQNPSLEVQIEAVKQNGWAIKYIKNSSLEVQLLAITGKEATHIINNIKRYIPNQHPELVKEYTKWVLNKINVENGFKKEAHVGKSFISVSEYVRRVRQLGCQIIEHEHTKIKFPNGKTLIFSPNNWDSNWMQQRRDLLNINRELDFVFKNPFIIPKDWDYQNVKMKVQIRDEIKKYNDIDLFFNQIVIGDIILKDGEEVLVEDIDWGQNEIMLEDGTIFKSSPKDKIRVRRYKID